MKLNAYQKFQLILAIGMVFLFLDLWIALQCGAILPTELKAMFAILWSILLLLTDPKELATVITNASGSLANPSATITTSEKTQGEDPPN